MKLLKEVSLLCHGQPFGITAHTISSTAARLPSRMLPLFSGAVVLIWTTTGSSFCRLVNCLQRDSSVLIIPSTSAMIGWGVP